jgi:DNA primase
VAGRILHEDIEALKRRADLADIISDHTKLQRSGSRLKGLCPFHKEKSPSFSVDPALGVYHCFGCQEGGDVYTFLERMEGLSFNEAVEQLARRVGYELRYEEMSASQKRELGERSRLVTVNQAALDFFRGALLSDVGTPARDYLKQRGFGREEADRFLLGYAPLEWEALIGHLRAARHSDDEIVATGLGVANNRGGIRDRFRGRLIFPILDHQNEPIGFGGRVVPGLDYGEHEPPKYLNSPETPLYKKHRVLYALSWARPEIVRSGEVLVCEGYTDVIGLHQAGFANAVATCGTAVGPDHLRALARYAERIVLAFDGDEAGGKAAERAFELSRDDGLDIRVLVMPEGDDPADVARRGGEEAIRELVSEAEPVVRFMMRRAVSGYDATPEVRAAAVEAAAPILAGLADPVLRDQYTRWAADLVGVGLGVVGRAVEDAGGELPGVDVRRTSVDQSATPARDASARAQLEREILRIAIQRPELLPDRWEEVGFDDFVHPRARQVFTTIVEAGGPGVPAETILQTAADDELRTLVRAIALEEFTVEPDEPHVAMLVGRVLLHRLERDITARKSELEAMNPTTDPDTYRQRFEELISLEARRRDLREYATG